MNLYTYSEELTQYKKHLRRLLRLFLVHILVFDGVYIWTRNGLLKQSITTIWTGLIIFVSYLVIKNIEKKHHRLHMQVQQAHGASTILYEGIDYYMTWTRAKIKKSKMPSFYVLFIGIYSILMLYILHILYRRMDLHHIVIIFLIACHLILIVSMYSPFIYSITPRYHFTKTCIIVNRSLVIPYHQIKKYQWLPQVHQGYFLDLNTGLHFARLIIEHLDQPKIESLLTASE